MIVDILFYLGIALLFTHELDAIQNHEWRILPILRKLEDKVAYYWFTILHIPVFFILLLLMCYQSKIIRFWFQISMDVFFILHMVLHKLLNTNKKCGFNGYFSKTIILIMGMVGIIHLSILVLLAFT